jgi:hypothetical protein
MLPVCPFKVTINNNNNDLFKGNKKPIQHNIKQSQSKDLSTYSKPKKNRQFEEIM